MSAKFGLFQCIITNKTTEAQLCNMRISTKYLRHFLIICMRRQFYLGQFYTVVVKSDYS